MDDEKEHIDAIYNAALEEIRSDWADDFAAVAETCESPIERIMLARLKFVSHGYGPRYAQLWDYGPNGGPGIRAGQTLADHMQDMDTYILPQVEIRGYRVDFLLLVKAAGTIKSFVVECDGHDFHERTKQQAQRDKLRDRRLTAGGFQVFRFTGSEIYRSEPDDDLLAELESAMCDFVESRYDLGKYRREK